MNLAGRVVTTALAVAATGALAAGLVDPAALASGAGLVAADQPGASQIGLDQVPSTLVCPPRPLLGEGSADSDEDFQAEGQTTSISLARSLATTSAATVSGRTLPPDGGEPAEVSIDAPALAATSTRSEVPFAVEADRSQLLAALQLTRTDDGDLAGLAASTCTAPADTGWLVGGAVEPGRSGRIVLANPSRTTATVDLTVLTPDGAVRPPAGQDLAVAAGTSREVLLESLLPATATLAVGVSSRGADVAAHLVETQIAGVRPQGVEQVVAQQPSTSSIVPGVLAAGRSIALRLANPGTETAAVGWQVRGPDGALVPTGESVVTVPPGSVVDLPLDLAGPGATGAVAVHIGSDVPVLGSVQMTWTRDEGRSERAWAVPAPAIEDQALALTAPVGVRTFLSLTSEDGADVTVQHLDAAGQLVDDEREVVLPPGAVETSLVDPGVAAVRLVVTSGVVHAALALTSQDEPRRPHTFFSVVPVQVPPPTTDEVTVAPLPEDLLR